MSDLHRINWNLLVYATQKKHIAELLDEFVEPQPNIPANNRWQYLFPFLDAFYKEQTVYFAVAKLFNRVISVIPLVETRQSKFFIHWHELGVPLHPHINMIVLSNSPDHSNAELHDQLLQRLQQESFTWDRFAIRNIATSQCHHGEYAGEKAWFNTAEDKPLNTLISKKLHRNIKRLKKRLQEKFPETELQVNIQAEDIEQALSEFIALEESSWKGEQQLAIANCSTTTQFYHDLMIQFSADHHARIYVYKHQNHILAAALGFKLGDCLYLHKIVFDKNHSDLAPGSVMVAEILQLALEDDSIQRVDLLNYPAWLNRWHPSNSALMNLVTYNKTLKGRSLYLTIHAWRFLKPEIKQFIDHAGNFSRYGATQYRRLESRVKAARLPFDRSI
ncbi:MAG: GNAT family N-acetyltransferase [Pseudomonadales bacterium]|nr:GNAT family N-acetyltransferase [Pseudomonadales bacterium]